jgi:hypothetical protein
MCRVDLPLPEVTTPWRTNSVWVATAQQRTAPTHGPPDFWFHVAGPATLKDGWPREAAIQEISGVVFSGKGRGSKWMPAVDWTLLGYEPVPGTLNVRTGPDAPRWLRRLPGGVHIPGAPMFKNRPAIYYPMVVGEIDVHARPYSNGVEVVAPVRLRDPI